MNHILFADKRFKIIEMSYSELDDICHLEESIFSLEDRFSRRRFRYLLASPNAKIFSCINNSGRIGYGIAIIRRLRDYKKQGRIYSIGILTKFRNKGVGSLLLKALEYWLETQGVSYITLETKRGAKGATAFFGKYGYVSTKLLPNYYGSSSGVRMKKGELENAGNKWS
ncbi:GNAT family N-acetyltransferase [bacterium]|nr:GNAT family N-acetyltransferase [bacterium]